MNNLIDWNPAGWFPVLTLIVGYAMKALSDWLQHRRTRERERETREAARRDRILERRVIFQRQTLLDLQEAVARLARAAGAIRHADDMAHRQTGQWGAHLVGDTLSDGFRIAEVDVSLLSSRVLDESIRTMVGNLRSDATTAVTARSEDATGQAMKSVSSVLDHLNQRIGQIVRELDDE